MPISVSPTQGDFLPAEMACPMSPDTLSSLVVWTEGQCEVMSWADCTDLDVKGGIEAHLEETLVILVENTQEALFEDRRGEGIGEDDDAVGGIGQGFHLEQTDLVETASKQIDSVSVVGGTFCEGLVEL